MSDDAIADKPHVDARKGRVAWTETGVRRSDCRQPARTLEQTPHYLIEATPETAEG
jgi:hypothetical protein